MTENNNYNNVHEDYRKMRDAMYETLEDARDALDLAKSILKESEHPRAVEVYAGLLKNVTAIQAQILELTRTYKDILTKKQHNETNLLGNSGQTTNNVFLGTTKDLQKQLMEAGLMDTIDVTPAKEE